MDPNNFRRATEKSVGFSSIYSIYTSEMFELVENRLFAYADESTLLAVVRKPEDRPAVAASLNKDMARIQEWCSHWCMILNPNKIKALVFSRSRTVSPPHGDLVLPGVSIRASPNLAILGMKFDSKLTFEDHMRGIVFPCLSENWYFEVGETYICGHLCVTSVLIYICSPNP